MTVQTKLTLHQLDGRDLPSAVVVNRPAEYATASIEFQQGFDQAVQDSLHGIAVDATVPTVAMVSAQAPPLPAGEREFTAAEANEIIQLQAQLNEINAQLAQIEAAKIKLREQQTTLQTARTVIGLQWDSAYAAFTAAMNAYNAFITNNPGYAQDTDKLNEALRLNADMTRLSGVSEGFAASYNAIDELIANTQQHIGALNEQVQTLNDIILMIDNRLRELNDERRNESPSMPHPFIPDTPELPFVLDANFFDVSKPLLNASAF